MHDSQLQILGLLYTAMERFGGLEGTIYGWTDAKVASEARQAGLDAERDRGTVAIPMGGHPNTPERVSVSRESGIIAETEHFRIKKPSPREFGEPIIDPSTLDSSGRPRNPYPGSGTLEFGQMLQPLELIAEIALSPVGESLVAGRQAFKVRATPRQQWHEVVHNTSWAEPDEYELTVDAERGILLSATAFFRGQAFAGKEIRSVSFDEPLPANNARWAYIGEVVNLLYNAQYSFHTVRASVREWRQNQEYLYRLLAVNPDHFRKEQPVRNGVAVFVYHKDIWWHFSQSSKHAETNTPLEDIPSTVNVTLDRRPRKLGEAMYSITDGEYGIVAEHSLNPSFLISGLWLEPMERTTFIGREAIRVQGMPTGASSRLWRWWDDADEYELLVDAERGTLLRLRVSHNGEELAGHEITEIEFDSPIPDHMFTFAPPAGVRVSVRQPNQTTGRI